MNFLLTKTSKTNTHLLNKPSYLHVPGCSQIEMGLCNILVQRKETKKYIWKFSPKNILFYKILCQKITFKPGLQILGKFSNKAYLELEAWNEAET